MYRSCLLFFSIRPSTLRVRLPRVGFCDDNRNVNRALKGIRKQLGALPRFNNTAFPNPSSASSDDSSAHGINNSSNSSSSGHFTPDSSSLTSGTAPTNHTSSVTHNVSTNHRTLTAELNARNRYHKSLWVSMKKRDSLSFDRICKQLRNSGLDLDSVSYTLMINGTLIFSKPDEMDQALAMIEEMKEAGLHPSLIRFLARLISLYMEMCYYNSRPLISNWLAVTRSSWLTAYLMSVKYRS